MTNQDFDPYTDPKVRALIGARVRALVQGHGFPSHLREDLFQELAFEIWRHMPLFDENKGPRSAYVKIILNRKMMKLIQPTGIAKILGMENRLEREYDDADEKYDARPRKQTNEYEPATRDYATLAPWRMSFHQVIAAQEPEIIEFYAQFVKHETLKATAQAGGHSEYQTTAKIQTLRNAMTEAGLHLGPSNQMAEGITPAGEAEKIGSGRGQCPAQVRQHAAADNHTDRVKAPAEGLEPIGSGGTNWLAVLVHALLKLFVWKRANGKKGPLSSG